jgi:glutamate--cysteine ligase
MSHHLPRPDLASPLRTLTELREHISGVCFKHGPPSRIGIELEWLLYDPRDSDRYPDLAVLQQVLGKHTPRTLDPNSPAEPLPHQGLVTVEPGGQIEISSAPSDSVADLVAAMSADIAYLSALLEPSGFVLSNLAADPFRSPRRLLKTPRYDAMADTFAEVGPAGAVMMCSTAATQVCIDLGSQTQAPTRWQAAHQLGPVLLAAFANSPRTAGELGTVGDLASARMAAWWRLDPSRTLPPTDLDVAGYSEAYIDRVIDAPVLARNRGEQDWRIQPGTTLRGWLDSGQPLDSADVDLHLSMLFPPVRPQGYLELRYFDAQPADEWIAPLALVAALFADDSTVEQVVACTVAAADRWNQATEIGLGDQLLRTIATDLWAIAEPQLKALELGAERTEQVSALLRRRFVEAISPANDQLSEEGSR